MSEIHEVQEVFQKLTEAGFSEQEINEEIKEKEREFHGFITEQGALFLIAKEKGINIQSPHIDSDLYKEIEQEIDYNEFTIKISDLQEKLTNIVLLGKISRVFPINDFMRKDGTGGIVGSFLLTDSTATTKIVLWDKHTEIMKTEFFKVGTIIRVINGYCKRGLKKRLEVHVSKQGKVQLLPEDIPTKLKKKLEQIEVNINKISHTYSKDDLDKLKIINLFKMDGFIKSISGIIQIEDLKEFEKENGEKSFLLKFLLNDETGTINVVVWGMQAIDILRIIENGMRVKLIYIFIEKNEYSKTKEIQFSKKSILEIL